MPVIVTVLGSGTCFPAPRSWRRYHPGFFIRWGEDEDQHLLLECSAGIDERLVEIGVQPSQVRHLAISHAHPDHCCLHGFLQTCLCCEMQRPGFSWSNPDAFPALNIYAPWHIVQAMPALNAFYFEGEGEKGLPFPILRLYAMNAREPQLFSSRELARGDRLWALPVRHDFGKADALAYRLELESGTVIAYSGDSGLCDNLGKTAEYADLFICEASARVGDDKPGSADGYGHLNPRQAGQVAKAAQAKHLVLTHYSGADSDEVMLEDCRGSGFEGEITIAQDFQVFKL